MLLCLHGNPLQGQEFEHLFPKLREKGILPVLHKRPIKGTQLEPLIQSVSATAKLSGSSPFGLLAYSWGAYLALAYLRRFPENVTHVMLVNPLLTIPKPLFSKPSQVILKAPIIRNLAYKFRNRSMASAYVESRFTPHKPPAEIRSRLLLDLSQAPTWRGERTYQKMMVTLPLSQNFGEFTIPVRVLVGVEDDVAPFEDQWKVLENFPNCSLKKIKGAGHALPWTHSDLILREIDRISSSY